MDDEPGLFGGEGSGGGDEAMASGTQMKDDTSASVVKMGMMADNDGISIKRERPDADEDGDTDGQPRKKCKVLSHPWPDNARWCIKDVIDLMVEEYGGPAQYLQRTLSTSELKGEFAMAMSVEFPKPISAADEPRAPHGQQECTILDFGLSHGPLQSLCPSHLFA